MSLEKIKNWPPGKKQRLALAVVVLAAILLFIAWTLVGNYHYRNQSFKQSLDTAGQQLNQNHDFYQSLTQ